MEFSAFVNETFHKLAQQGRQSLAMHQSPALGMGMGCAYRDDRGGHCAIGFWIENEAAFHGEHNTSSIAFVANYLPDWMKRFNSDHLVGMQRVHDYREHWISPDALWSAMKGYVAALNIRLDQSIEAEIWANWKGEPPGDLKAIDTYKPDYKTKSVKFNEYLMSVDPSKPPSILKGTQTDYYSFSGYGYAGTDDQKIKISSKSWVDHTSW